MSSAACNITMRTAVPPWDEVISTSSTRARIRGMPSPVVRSAPHANPFLGGDHAVGLDRVGAGLGDGELEIVDPVVGQLEVGGGHGRDDEAGQGDELRSGWDLQGYDVGSHPVLRDPFFDNWLCDPGGG